MSEPYLPLGIDISKDTFHVALLKGEKVCKYQQFTNNAEGFAQLSQWLVQQGVEQVHGCLEATSIYGHALAIHLHQQRHRVSIVNPLRIKGYAKSQLARTKEIPSNENTCRRVRYAALTAPYGRYILL